MLRFAESVRLFSVGCLAIVFLSAPAVPQDLAGSVCRVTIYDESVELEDSRLAVDLAKSRFQAYEKIFKMIEGLWEGKAIPRMDYIKAKYDLDAARLDLEKYNLILDRQAALVEQYRLICGGPDSGNTKEAIQDAYDRYRKADCDAEAKAIEVARTNLEYDREYLKSIQDLRKDNFASDRQVILAELDVEFEEKNLADATRRTSACRAELNEVK